MNLQTRLELQAAVQQLIDNFMTNNRVSPSLMEDALNKVMVGLKDAVMTEYLIQQQQQMEEILKAGEQANADAESSTEAVKEEENGESIED
jgi:glycerol-3-phosphate responsive antiterminator